MDVTKSFAASSRFSASFRNLIQKLNTELPYLFIKRPYNLELYYTDNSILDGFYGLWRGITKKNIYTKGNLYYCSYRKWTY